jgi:hypothetical protein
MGAMPEMPKKAGSDSYLKLAELKDMPGGSDDVWFLSEFIVGFEGWRDNGKKGEPVRGASMADFDPNEKWLIQDGKPRTPKPFAAAYLWRPSKKCVQVGLFTQVTITDAITGLENNKHWGDVRGYSITITRSDKDGKISYSVMPGSKGELPPEAQAAWEKVKEESVGLDALFLNGDPFELWSAK